MNEGSYGPKREHNKHLQVIHNVINKVHSIDVTKIKTCKLSVQ